MGLDPKRQAVCLLLAAALGLLLGLCYDALRPPRRKGGALLTVLLDLAFGLLAAWAAFLYAMGVGEGRLGLWALTASFLGFLLYWRLFSPIFSPLWAAAFACICSMIELTKKLFEKLQIFAKKYFQNVRK